MRAAYVEFVLESSTMNVREFYASNARTHRFFAKEAVASAITYAEVLLRDKREEYQPLTLPFDCTPAEAIEVRTTEVIYRAGDDPKTGLLRFGRQELLLPGSRFRFVAWGDVPSLHVGQVFLIGKKRAAAVITACIIEDNVEPDTISSAPMVLPVQVTLPEVGGLSAYRPIVATARYLIVAVPLLPGVKRLKVSGFAVPLVS